MPTIKDLQLSRITNSLNTDAPISRALAELGGFDLAELSAEYNKFVNSEVQTRGLSEFRASNDTLTVGQNAVVIELVAADGDGAALLAELEALGMMHGGAFSNAVSGLFPIANLELLPSIANVALASATYVQSRVGSVDNQADVAMNTDDVRTNFGVDGDGITIGILSDSFDTAVINGNASIDYADDIASGDLPAGINVLLEYNQFDASDEGRAMAQLIHDVAPGATLEFASAFFGPAAFAQSIQDLAVNSDVIVDDIGYLTQPFFQDGVIAQAVDTVFAGGDAYFSAAGNSARQSYESDFRETATSVQFGLTGQWHDFDPGPGVDLAQDFVMGNGQQVLLSVQWDDPYLSGAPGSGGALTDINVSIVDTDTNAVVATGANANIGGDPFEFFLYTNTTGSAQNLAILIDRDAGPTPGVIKYMDFRSGTITNAEFATNSGTSFGHPSAEGGLGVGAAFYAQTPEFGQTPPLLENFSSLGDTPILFDAAGNRLATAEVRERIDITAPDGTDTTFFGSQRDATPAPNFSGTSAAAPHAAALAALLLEADGTLSPTDIYDALKDSAIDILNTSGGIATGVGYDNWSGHGLVDAPLAFAEAGITGSALVVDIATDEDDGNTSAGDLSLREAIGIAQTTGQNIIFDDAVGGIRFFLDSGLGTINITSGEFSISGMTASNEEVAIWGDAGVDDLIVTNAMGQFVTDVENNTNDADNIQIFNITGASTDVTFENLLLTGGVADDGGAVSVASDASLTLDKVTIQGNKATFDGGGIKVSNGDLTIMNSTVADNVAAFDGGGLISNTDTSGNDTQIFNSTFSGNEAGDDGGGIFNLDGDLRVANSTITLNSSSDDGSGLAALSDGTTNTEIVSTIIAGNTGSADLANLGSPTDTITSGGNNLIGSNDGAGDFVDGTNGDQVGTVGTPLDPLLGALADNGGVTATHLPQAGSTALDAGANPDGLFEDQRGEARTSGTQIDIGSVELQVAPPQPDIVVDSLVLNTTLFVDGGPITADWVTRNAGTAPAGNVFDTGLYISTDATVTTGDFLINFLDTDNVDQPGDSQAQTLVTSLPEGLAAGTYFVGAIGDDFGQVGESDETNNTSNVVQVSIVAAQAVALFDNTGVLIGQAATISTLMPSAAFSDVFVVNDDLYSANPETVLIDAQDLTFELPEGVTPTLVLGEFFGVFDVTVVGAGAAEIVGNSSDNTLNAGDGDNALRGGEGADTLNGGGGDDLADYSDSGARVEISLSADTADGGTATGDDLNSIEDIRGSDFNDLLSGNSFDNMMMGGESTDNINGAGGDDELFGEAGNDQISGGNNDDTINGGTENDLLFGNGGNDSIIGGLGEDTVFGGAGHDVIEAGADNDSVLGQGGEDDIIGGGGDDILRGGSGNDFMQGGADNDTLFGNGNNDTIEGGGGNDSIQGAAGSDDLSGNSGNDTLFSGNGADRLDGGTGDDLMNGGVSDGVRDTFVFLVGYDEDRINQFDQAGTDRIELDEDLWLDTDPGGLTEQQVVDTFGTLNGNSTILTLDFGGGDILEVQNSGGITQGTLGLDIVFV